MCLCYDDVKRFTVRYALFALWDGNFPDDDRPIMELYIIYAVENCDGYLFARRNTNRLKYLAHAEPEIPEDIWKDCDLMKNEYGILDLGSLPSVQ